MIQDPNFVVKPAAPAIARASPNNLIQTADRCAPTQTRVPPEPPMSEWTPKQSAGLYRVNEWGTGFFSVSEDGNLLVHPRLS